MTIRFLMDTTCHQLTANFLSADRPIVASAFPIPRGKHLGLNVYWREDRSLVEIADRAVKLYSALADFTEHPSATHWVALSKAMDYYQEYWFNEFEGERANES